MRFHIVSDMNVRLLGSVISRGVDLWLTELNKGGDERAERLLLNNAG